MTILQADELKDRGILTNGSSKIVLQGETFEPGPSFAKAWRQAAISFCEELKAKGYSYLLVEDSSCLTTWRPTPKSETPHSLQTVPQASDPVNPSTRVQGDSTSVQSPLTKVQSHVPALDPTFIQACQQELALCIGPMAQLVLEQVLSKSSHMDQTQLVNRLVANIPNPEAAAAFRQKLL